MGASVGPCWIPQISDSWPAFSGPRHLPTAFPHTPKTVNGGCSEVHVLSNQKDPGRCNKKKQVSHGKKTGCLGYKGDEILPKYVGIVISHDKDPY